MTQPRNPDHLPLDKDRINRMAMEHGSRQLLERLCTHHPKIVAHLRKRAGLDA